jgi:plasmid replication initiation protein
VPEPKTGEPAYLATHLFDFFTLPIADTDQATVRFGLPQKLQPILAGSNRWGRIKAEVVCALTSKYAIALYEMVQLRANLDRCIETFAIERFRDLLGVPPGAYKLGADFIRRVTDPALLEVNGLSDMSVDLTLVRRGKFAPIEAVTVTWWRKEGDDFRAVMQERNRSKVGRMARLRGSTVETVAPLTMPLPSG